MLAFEWFNQGITYHIVGENRIIHDGFSLLTTSIWTDIEQGTLNFWKTPSSSILDFTDASISENNIWIPEWRDWNWGKGSRYESYATKQAGFGHITKKFRGYI